VRSICLSEKVPGNNTESRNQLAFISLVEKDISLIPSCDVVASP